MARSKNPKLRPATAVGYIRISHEKQRTNFSLETQDGDVADSADIRHLDLLRTFCDEAKSARYGFDERPAWKELMAYLRIHKGEIGYVIVSSVCRFARNQAQAAMVREMLLEEFNVIVIAHNADIDPESDIACVTTPLFDSIAEYDNRVRGSRTRKGMETASRNGWLMGSTAPYGYKKEFSARHGRRVVMIDEIASEHIRYLFDAFVNTSMTQVEIHAELSARGFTKKSKQLSYLLRNPAYCGEIRVKNDSNTLSIAQHEPIISKHLFAQAQAKLTAKIPRHTASHSPKGQNEDRALKAVLICSVCQKRFTFGYCTSHTGKRYPYYNCPRWCISLSPSQLNHALRMTLSSVVASIPKGIHTLFERVYQDYFSIQQKEERKELLSLQAESARLALLRQKAWDYRLLGKMQEEDFEHYNARTLQDEAKCKDALLRLNKLFDEQAALHSVAQTFLSTLDQHAPQLSESSLRSILNWLGIHHFVVNMDDTLSVVLRKDTTSILTLIPHHGTLQT